MLHLSLSEVSELIRLRPYQRLFHRSARRHILGVALGIGIGMVGVALTHIEISWINSKCLEFFAWTLHAFGTVPIMRHIEPLWNIFLMETES